MDVRPSPLTGPLTRRQLFGLDVACAFVYTNVLLTMAARQGSGWVPYAVAAGMGVPLAFRRRWPRAVFALAFLLTVTATALGIVYDHFVGAAFALYTVALARPRPDSEPTTAIGIVSAVALLLLTVAGPVSSGGTHMVVLVGAALLGAAWTIGRAVRERRVYAALSAEQMARRAVAGERLRIARELHDVVAHGMSLIAVKASVANHVVRSRPGEAHDALRVIEETSRKAMREIRQLLGVLRSDEPGEDGAPHEDSAAQLTPAPGPEALPELVDRAAAAGVSVDLDVRGVDDVPEGMRVSIYRIVQEAVTNVVRHAAPARCRVRVAGTDGAVTIEITDDGPGVGQPGHTPGYGLVGIRERVAVYGGTFNAGPLPGGGFAVSARLPRGPEALT